MALYYIVASDGMRHGPMSAHDLLNHGLTAQSPVWHEGLTDWVSASEVPELMELLAANTPPAFTYPYTRGNQAPEFGGIPPRPSSYLAFAIICTILCCLPFGIVAIVYASRVDNLWNSGNYAEAQNASKKARNWVIAGAVCSLAFMLLYLLAIFFGLLVAVGS